MRIFVMLVQLGALAYVAIMIVINGGPTDLAQLSFMSAMVFPPLSAAYYIGFHTVNAKDSYLGLFFERRKLEEKAKINKLKSEIK